MAKYHINIHGEPVRCPAQKKCRANGGSVDNNGEVEHFEGTLEEARAWTEEKNAEAAGSHLKTMVSQKGEEYDSRQKTPEEVGLTVKTFLDNNLDWIPGHSKKPKNLDGFNDPAVSANWCETVSDSIRKMSYYDDRYNGPKMEKERLETNTPYLKYHVANSYIDDNGDKYVVDHTFAQIDDSYDVPYVAPYGEWKEKVLETSENPKKEIKEALYTESGRPKNKVIRTFKESETEKHYTQKFLEKIDSMQKREEFEDIMPIVKEYDYVSENRVLRNPHLPHSLRLNLYKDYSVTNFFKNLPADDDTQNKGIHDQEDKRALQKILEMQEDYLERQRVNAKESSDEVDWDKVHKAMGLK